MSSLEAKREQFRKYLDRSGVFDALSQALIKLYEEPNKPENAVEFVQKHLCETCPDDDGPAVDVLKADLEQANKTIAKLELELENFRGSVKRTVSENKIFLEENLEKLQQNEESTSMMKKLLTKELIDELCDVKTSFGSSLADCIEPGLNDHSNKIGIHAVDPDCYKTFSKLFEPVLKELNAGKFDEAKGIHQPKSDWGDPAELENFDIDESQIISIRACCDRNLEGYPFFPGMNEKHFLGVQEKIKSVVENLEGEHKGEYTALEDLDDETQAEMVKDGTLFGKSKSSLDSEGCYKLWPIGRGVYSNPAKTFLIWINERSHLRIISMEKSKSLFECINRLMTGILELEKGLKFLHDEKLGYLTANPENLGPTLEVSIRIKLPGVAANSERLHEILTKHNLQLREKSSENIEEGTLEILNEKSIGRTEFEIIKQFSDGILELINEDKNE